MQARVKSDHRWNDVRAQGVEYIKGEFRAVPEGDEKAVMANPGLETKGKASAPAAAENGDLSKLTVKELKAMAAEAGVEVPSKAKKADLIEALGG